MTLLFDKKRTIGMFLICVCIAGAISLFFISDVFGNSSRASDVNGGSADTNNGPATTQQFSLRKNQLHNGAQNGILLRPNVAIHNLLIICTVDAITDWSVSDESVAEVVFNPAFTIQTKAVGEVTITITARRSIGGQTWYETLSLEFAVVDDGWGIGSDNDENESIVWVR